MGYACPVCETPQRDAEHLANHLAFTAMLHGDAHERWLDERVPEWADLGADDLAPAVADHADETGYDEVFEESIPEGGHAYAHEDHDTPPGGASSTFAADDLDGDARRTLAEAREMTRAMLEADADAGDENEDEGDADDDGKA
ncbi:DUF5810 domain-containing protein [Haloplanus litoreus]|uniref:DUF5810 domain-containing protein n=1 Tax=Haloplanus litoreus TaxID=767515 RepID=A0ABD5ZUB7_9EURY